MLVDQNGDMVYKSDKSDKCMMTKEVQNDESSVDSRSGIEIDIFNEIFNEVIADPSMTTKDVIVKGGNMVDCGSGSEIFDCDDGTVDYITIDDNDDESKSNSEAENGDNKSEMDVDSENDIDNENVEYDDDDDETLSSGLGCSFNHAATNYPNWDGKE